MIALASNGSSTPLVWVTAPPSGGRAGLAHPLVEAFRGIGCRAEEMSFRLLQENLPPDLDPAARGRAVVTAFWTRFRSEQPALILDVSPLPADLILNMRRAGARAAFWLLEDALDPAYDYWKETIPSYDLFFTFQGAPFDHPAARYLAWGASSIAAPPETMPDTILLHGTASPHREAFLRGFVESLGDSPLPVRVIGPGWARVRRAGWPDNVSFESRWTDPETTRSLLAGQIVLLPQSRSVNAVAPRLWEALASGACVVTEEVPLLSHHFEIGRDLFAVRDACATAECVRELLEKPERARATAISALAAIARNGLLTHRAAAMLTAAGIPGYHCP